MTKWEYKRVSGPVSPLGTVEIDWTALGNEGWEFSCHDGGYKVFKRPITDAPAAEPPKSEPSKSRGMTLVEGVERSFGFMWSRDVEERLAATIDCEIAEQRERDAKIVDLRGEHILANVIRNAGEP